MASRMGRPIGRISRAVLILAIALLGNPATLRLTVPVKPLILVTVMVEAPVEPCLTTSELGLAEIEKSGPTTTVTDTE